MDAVDRRDRKPDVSRQGHAAPGWFGRGLPSAGIYAGPAAWLIGTQANYALVPWVCAHQVQVIPIVAVVMAAFSLFGGLLSWRGYVRAAPTSEPDSTGAGQPHRFVALIGVGIALLFTAIIIVHGIAGVVFHGCER